MSVGARRFTVLGAIVTGLFTAAWVVDGVLIRPTFSVADLGRRDGSGGVTACVVNDRGEVYGVRRYDGQTRAFRAAPGGSAADATDLGRVSMPDLTLHSCLNAAGQVAATALVQVGPQTKSRAVRIAAGGTFASSVDLDVPPGRESSTASAINASGRVTGHTVGADRVFRVFRTAAEGGVTAESDLGLPPGFTAAVGTGINASGQVTGTAFGPSGPRAFRTAAAGGIDAASVLGSLSGDKKSHATAINDNGQVTGHAQNRKFQVRAFRTPPGGRLTPDAELGTLDGYLDSYGAAINNAGSVVGYAHYANLGDRAFLYDTRMRDLNGLIPPDSGWELYRADSISDTGFIAGSGSLNGLPSAFLLTPVSVPAVTKACPWLVAAAGSAAGLYWCFRRRQDMVQLTPAS